MVKSRPALTANPDSRPGIIPEREFGFAAPHMLDSPNDDSFSNKDYNKNYTPEIEFWLALPVGFAQNEKEK